MECCWTVDSTGARISATRTPVLPAKIVQQGVPVTEQVLGTVTIVTNHHHLFSIMVQSVIFVGDLLLTKRGVIKNKRQVVLVLQRGGGGWREVLVIRVSAV